MDPKDLGNIDRSVPIPFYYQISDILLKKIESREFLPHQQIPSEDQLASIFGVSRMTVRQAISSLVNNGKLYRKHGHGTFIAEPMIERKVARLSSVTVDIEEAGLRPGSIILQKRVVKPPEKVQGLLKLKEGDEILEILRLRLANEEPLAIGKARIPVKLFPRLVEADLEGVLSLTQYLEREFGCKIDYAEQSIQAVSADSYQAKLLKIRRGASLLHLSRIFFTNDHVAIGIFETFYRGDRYIFTSTLYR
jgi:GntR family transcriptional regulator